MTDPLPEPSSTFAPADTTADTADVAARIRGMLAKDFQIDPEALTPDARLEELGVDSIGMAEVIFNVEDEFGLKLPDTAVQLATFGDVVRYIEDALAAQNTPPSPAATTSDEAAAPRP